MSGISQESRQKAIIELLSDCDYKKVVETVTYLKNTNPYLTPRLLAEKFIHSTALKNGIKGGLAGAGAGLMLPAAVAILGGDIIRSLKAQRFLLSCIAYIYGKDPRDMMAQVHTMVLTSSNSFDEVLEELDEIFCEEFVRDLLLGSLIRYSTFAGTQQFNKAYGQKISQIAAKVAVDVLGRKVADFTMKGLKKHFVKLFWNIGGKRIAQGAAQKAIGRAIPVVGAVAGFAMDWVSLRRKGELAIQYYEAGMPVIIDSLASNSPPRVDLISEGENSDTSIVYISGFNTGNNKDDDMWERKLREAGWLGNIYRFWWDSGNLEWSFLINKLRERLSDDVISPVSEGEGVNYAGLSADAAISIFKLNMYWRKHRQNAKLMGAYYLPKLISESSLFSNTKITFLAHSLGSELLRFALEVWPVQTIKKNENSPPIDRCILMGGASDSSHQTWLRMIDKFCDPIIGNKQQFILNLYNFRDVHLRILLQLGELFPNLNWNLKPVGRYEIALFAPQVKNIDCSSKLKLGHDASDYLNVLAETNEL